MTRKITRRNAMAGTLALAGTALAGCTRETYVPPNYGSLFGPSDTMTMAVQRLLLWRQPLAREYQIPDISGTFPTVGTVMPKDTGYLKALERNFSDWRLPVGGLVRKPLSLSLDDLRDLPARTQITAHSCERGWTAIAEWTGTPLATVLEAAEILPQARYVAFECVDGWYDSVDMFDAVHPQTILAYGMNGGQLPVRHGAPLRLRVERHLGYKHLKYVQRISLVDSLKGIRSGKGSLAAELGYSWYAGI